MNFNIKTRQTIISMRIGENKEQVFVVIFTKLQKVRLEKQIHLKQLNNSAKYLILSYCFSSHIKCILNRTTNNMLISFKNEIGSLTLKVSGLHTGDDTHSLFLITFNLMVTNHLYIFFAKYVYGSRHGCLSKQTAKLFK